MNKTHQQIDTFFSQYKTTHYKKKEIILRPDSMPSGVMYIKKGNVRLYLLSEDGMEFTVIIYKAGDIFPLRWAMNGTENIYYFEALTSIEVTSAPKTEFLSEIKKNAEFLQELTEQLLFDYGALIYRIQHIVFGNAYSKIASIILTAAKQFGDGKSEHITLPLRLTHQQIALSAGITRETASIEVKRLENEGVIRYKDHHIIVQDMPHLEEIAYL